MQLIVGKLGEKVGQGAPNVFLSLFFPLLAVFFFLVHSLAASQ